MSNNIAISVKNVSKCYRVYANQRARLRHALLPTSVKGTSEIWALRDINFDIERGHAVAIIGRNGAGKSTLLEIITQTLTPTTGEVRVRGKIAALLELGSGFNPEYSGQENVFLNGLLMGLSRAEVEQRYDDILSFADIGDVLDRPVKSYSSGMLMRLAFAVQVALDPEILIVDEALSVGDYFFQQKCFARLQKMRESGLTLLFVSHNMGTVRDLCTDAIYIKEGLQVFHGESSEATRLYFRDGKPTAKPQARATAAQQPIELDHALVEKVCETAIWRRPPENIARLIGVHFMDATGDHVTGVVLGTRLVVRAFIRLNGSELPLTIGLVVKNKYDQIIFATTNHVLKIPIWDSKEASISAFDFAMDMGIEGGQYSLKITCSDPTAEVGARDDSGWIGPLHINWDYGEQVPPFMGMFGIPTSGKSMVLNRDFFL